MFAGAVGDRSRMRVDANWGTNNGTSPQTSATRTFQTKGSGTLKFGVTGTVGTLQYSKNGGAFTTYVDTDTLAIAPGDTLALKMTGSSGNNKVTTITDNTYGDTVGTWTSGIT